MAIATRQLVKTTPAGATLNQLGMMRLPSTLVANVRPMKTEKGA